ncbi:MAG: hypothetical protein LBV66_01190, partial [Elusimicrobiota bacterium]|nr:hypothetical protein [Elusimicrobiota bacterium]
SGVESIKNHFRDNNFKYETIPNKVSGLEGILIKGSFQRRNKKYGIRQQLIKKGNNFWQILAIFEDSDKNNAEADKYINSVSISDLS